MQSRVVIQRLQRDGWLLARVSGSHHQFVHPDKPGHRVTVVHPKKTSTSRRCAVS
jgi:predicted RNA binding protein YcfA (HicA-like mRNA interferase family)